MHWSCLCCRNVFSDDGTSKPDDSALRAVQASIEFLSFASLQAMTMYARREVSCLSLTDKEAMFSGNFMFTPVGTTTSGPVTK
ncbi:hypothetical protein Pint_18253 [Pistacia integerrima]|uniref:Uncharacterized protein n=1 Tax=Pistacia integerrima TaxID=434235 RepID=A0ACC0YZN7_9ROSI|nr:hypothetical protein Pint_18253 [Pistacia integerrima]